MIDFMLMGDTDAVLPTFGSSRTEKKQPDYAMCDESVFDLDQDNTAGARSFPLHQFAFLAQQLLPPGSLSLSCFE